MSQGFGLYIYVNINRDFHKNNSKQRTHKWFTNTLSKSQGFLSQLSTRFFSYNLYTLLYLPEFLKESVLSGGQVTPFWIRYHESGMYHQDSTKRFGNKTKNVLLFFRVKVIYIEFVEGGVK